MVQTLEELIEQCGDNFRWLKKKGYYSNQATWLAQGHVVNSTLPDIRAYGKTPREAVEGLVKELQKKVLEKVDHEQRKLLDGFAHPKNCAECNQTKQ